MSFSTEYEALAFINAVYGCSDVKPVIDRHTENRIGYEGRGTYKNDDALIVLSTEEDDDD